MTKSEQVNPAIQEDCSRDSIHLIYVLFSNSYEEIITIVDLRNWNNAYTNDLTRSTQSRNSYNHDPSRL